MSDRGDPQFTTRAAGARRWRDASQPGPQLRIMSGAVEPKSLRRPVRTPAATSVLSAAAIARSTGHRPVPPRFSEAKTPSGMIATFAPAFLAEAIATRSMVPTSWPATSTGWAAPTSSRERRSVARAAPMARGVGKSPTGRWTPVISSSGAATPV